MGAAGLALLSLLAAMVIDLAFLEMEGRRLQSAADLAALSAARDLDRAAAAAAATARDNLSGTLREAHAVETTTGAYDPDPRTPPRQRFRAAAGSPNAARVRLSGPASLHFGRVILGRDSVMLSRQATAARPHRETAAFSIGSRLARLDGGLANQLLHALIGAKVSLSAADYRSLAEARISLPDALDALATEADLRVGDYARLADAEIEAGPVLRRLAAMTPPGAASALNRLATAAGGMRLKAGDLIGVDASAPHGLKGAASAQVSALDLAMAMLEIGGGERQAALDLAVPSGLADIRVMLAIGERPVNSPWLTVSDRGEPTIRTAQVRLSVVATTSQALALLGRVELPLIIEAAPSEARLADIRCTPDAEVRLDVRPGVARVMVGRADARALRDFSTPLSSRSTQLASLAGIATVKGRAEVTAADAGFQPTTFSAADIARQRVRTVQSRAFASGAVTSLLQRLDLEVTALGLGVNGRDQPGGRAAADAAGARARRRAEQRAGALGSASRRGGRDGPRRVLPARRRGAAGAGRMKDLGLSRGRRAGRRPRPAAGPDASGRRRR